MKVFLLLIILCVGFCAVIYQQVYIYIYICVFSIILLIHIYIYRFVTVHVYVYMNMYNVCCFSHRGEKDVLRSSPDGVNSETIPILISFFSVLGWGGGRWSTPARKILSRPWYLFYNLAQQANSEPFIICFITG